MGRSGSSSNVDANGTQVRGNCASPSAVAPVRTSASLDAATANAGLVVRAPRLRAQCSVDDDEGVNDVITTVTSEGKHAHMERCVELREPKGRRAPATDSGFAENRG